MRAARHVFAERGFFGTPTVDIAAAAGLSHGYMFKVIGSKEKLFVAVVDACFAEILSVFEVAAAGSAGRSPAKVLDAIGKSYAQVLADRDLLLIQLHAAAAAARVPAIRDAVRKGFAAMVEFVRSATGADDATLQQWFAIGMLANFIAAMDAERLRSRWARTLVGELVFHAAR